VLDTIVVPTTRGDQIVSKKSKPEFSFEKAEDQIDRERLIITVQAWTKNGSSHFGLTAPKPLLIQDINGRLEGTLKKFKKTPGYKDIYVTHYKTPETKIKEMGSTRSGQKIKASVPREVRSAERVVEDFIGDFKQAIAEGIRSVVWDKANEFWDTVRLADLELLSHVGQEHYGVLNRRMRDLLALATDSDINLIMTHDLGEEYTDDGNGRGRPSGRFKRVGWKWMDRQSHMTFELQRTGKMSEVKFVGTILDCAHDPELNGYELENPTFADVAMLVFPETTEDDWQ